MTSKNLLMITSAATAIAAIPGTAMAQSDDAEASTNADTADTYAPEITVIGSRRPARSALDSAVPVDVLQSSELKNQGSNDIIDSLTSIVPSLSANREPISDAATLVRPINLRGLPSDATLVLVNGKRWHRGAVVGEFVAGINKGSQGVDITPLFAFGLKQVQVLRDGAAAQYGSDAIAGVINYELIDDPDAHSLSVQYGQSYRGDGKTVELNGALGTHLGDGGFLALAFQVKDQNDTSRGVQDGQGSTGGAYGLGAAGFPVTDPVVTWGQPNVKNDYKIILNSALPIGDSELYMFGTYASRDVDGSFFYRNPTSRQGVFASGSNVLFADTTGAGGCPVGALPTSSFAAAQAFIDSAPSNCFAFFSKFPGGFTPRFGGSVKDYGLNGGFKGAFDNGLTYDFSLGFGSNSLDYRIDNTVNASLGPDSPTRFYLGSQIESDYVANADFTLPVNVGLYSDLNVAWGLQYQNEQFEIKSGDPASYIAGAYASQGFSVGSNGFQGFSDKVAGKFQRNSVGAYFDLEADVTSALLLSGAVRYEHYSDAGDTFNGKIAARYKIGDHFAVRGSASTGFRAPTLGQSNLQRAATAFSNGQLIETLVIASTNPIAEFYGGGQLKPEKSMNFSLGATANFGHVNLTVDYYNIRVKDRVALTTATVSDADRATLIAMGNPEAATISSVQFFVNDFDTRTQGLDVVASAPVFSSLGNTQFTLALNYNNTKVVNLGTTVTPGLQRELEYALPKTRFTFTASHDVGIFNGLVRVNYYSKAFENLFNDETLPITTPAMATVDMELGVKFAGHFRAAVGAKNVFNTVPAEWSLNGDTGRTPGYLGAIYPLNHPAGFNGGSYYLRLTTDF